MVTSYNFEILCVDPKNKAVFQDAEAFVYGLSSHSILWRSRSLIGTPPNGIQDRDMSLNVEKLDVDSAEESLATRTFLVKCCGSYERLESLRLPICKYIKSQGFDFTYILFDEISEFIAQQIYPGINKVENRLRRYIIKFFITKLGPNWWDVTADAEMKNKATKRKNNETVFGSVIDNKIYLIDFGELGKIVYKQSSGYINREDIIQKVLSMENSSEAVEKLKEELQSNYTKFFKEAFKDQDFQQQWEELEKLRHKVAHNNLFTDEDLQRCEKLTTSLLKTIEDADSKVETIDFSADDLETIKYNIIEISNPYKVISENEMLENLKQVEEKYSATNRWVGLSSFVKNHLGLLGYDYATSYSVINQLEQKGKVEFYTINSSHGFPVTAVKLKKS
ncbi:MAG: Swt1 family HEPN domain-containing protein [Coleofasciculaceae cyanobacterium]